VQPQVLLDMLLMELDRGIDLLALGSHASENDQTKWRAYAMWAIIRAILNVLTGQYLPGPPVPSPPTWWTLSGQVDPNAPIQLPGPIQDYQQTPHAHPRFATDLASINTVFGPATANVPGFNTTFSSYQLIPLTQIPGSFSKEHSKIIAEELLVQLNLEDRWENLVRTIAVEAGDQTAIFELLKQVIKQAAYDVLNPSGETLPTHFVQPLPPQFEQSLRTIARRVG
jgi:hypothetical protein